MSLPHPVSPARLAKLVAAAKAGGPCLERRVHEALWGGQVPKMWRDWPLSARATWDAAVRLYRAKGGLAPEGRVASEGHNGRPHAVGAPTVGAIWAAIRTLGIPWPKAPGLRVAELARLLGCSTRVLSYQMRALGWEWAGRFGDRRVERAPCVLCRRSMLATRLDPGTGWCRRCREGHVSRAPRGASRAPVVAQAAAGRR